MSSIAHSSECVDAGPITAGDTATCSGMGVLKEQAKQRITGKKVNLPAVEELLRLEKLKSAKYKTLSETLKSELDIATSAPIESGFSLSTVLLFAVSGALIGIGAGFYAGAVQ